VKSAAERSVLMNTMPSLQIREMPDELYEALSRRAQQERRSLAQQAVADLMRLAELEARDRRIETVERLRRRRSPGVSDPVRLVREDRER
jgi:antitoxin FitA